MDTKETKEPAKNSSPSVPLVCVLLNTSCINGKNASSLRTWSAGILQKKMRSFGQSQHNTSRSRLEMRKINPKSVYKEKNNEFRITQGVLLANAANCRTRNKKDRKQNIFI